MRITGLFLFIFVLCTGAARTARPDRAEKILDGNKGLLHLLDRAGSGGAASDQAIEIIKNSSVYPGKSVNYTVNVRKYKHSGLCRFAASFNRSNRLPNERDNHIFAINDYTFERGNGNVRMTKTGGANATAANGNFSRTGTANRTVTSPTPPLTVTDTDPQGPVKVRQTVAMATTVLLGASPASGKIAIPAAFTVH